MFGVDDVIVVLVAAALVNLVVEIGVEAVADWVENSSAPPAADPGSEQIHYTPEWMQASAQIDQTAEFGLAADGLTLVVGKAVMWSEQMIGTVGGSLGLL